MNYRIEKKESFTVIGQSKRVSTSDGKNNQQIPVFWDEVSRNGVGHQILEIAENEEFVGVCMDFDQEKEEFTYMIGAETTNQQTQFEEREIGKNTWAVFESVGPLPEAIQSIWQRIFSEWFPTSGYEHADEAEFELYPPGNTADDNYSCEVWIPVMRK
ncbi:GyrI-like domain-containing protein [Bacillus sp. 2205SS5-2]|uniref:GyrI-like domain-containing protein n=1 Tax=Bacillus sp. 2205SS5-2 TaxID=3109031 RepID=UPI00300761EC